MKIRELKQGVKLAKFFICQVCNQEFAANVSKKHLKLHRLSEKQYYIKFISNKNKCKCGKSLIFYSLTKGFSKYCSKEHFQDVFKSYAKKGGYARQKKYPHLSSKIMIRLNKENPNIGKNLKKYHASNPEFRYEIGHKGGTATQKQNKELYRKIGQKYGKVNLINYNKIKSKFKKRTGFDTEAEMKFAQFLKSNKIAYCYEPKLFIGKVHFKPDFIIKNVIIEIWGNYHKYPAVIEADKTKKVLFESAGYKLITVLNEDLDNDIFLVSLLSVLK